ncbi:transposase [Clostridium aceticum]|nr:transposase [Clostridium aceticum]KJF28359.1 transposase [Clostridium aceticum]
MVATQKRKKIRLKDYKYSENGVYFITICTKNRQNLLWDVGATCGRLNIEPPLSDLGKIIDGEIHKIDSIYENAEINKYVIMPNHIHMIIILNEGIRRPQVAPTISRILQQFKGSITKQVGCSIWQKSFYDHIIRNELDYQKIWQYIDTNPVKWKDDQYYI